MLCDTFILMICLVCIVSLNYCLIQYTVSREGAPNIYFGDDDTIRQFWHDDSIGHSGAMHLFYRPVNDMRVLLPLVVCIIVAWIRSFFFLMGTYVQQPYPCTLEASCINAIDHLIFPFLCCVVLFVMLFVSQDSMRQVPLCSRSTKSSLVMCLSSSVSFLSLC